MITLWGRLTSINVRKVAFTLQWLGVPFERINAGREFGVVGTDDYRHLNPNAQVPTLQDGDLVLWESNVIVRYLCKKYGHLQSSAVKTPPYPHTDAALFEAEKWMDWQQTTFNPAGRDAFVQLIRTAPVEQDQDKISASVLATNRLIALLDAHLADKTYLLGDAPTMADIPLLCELHRFWGLPLDERLHPAALHPHHVQRWFDAWMRHPASQGVFDLPLA